MTHAARPRIVDLRLAVAASAAWAAAWLQTLHPGWALPSSGIAFALAVVVALTGRRQESLRASAALALAAVGLVLASVAAQSGARHPAVMTTLAEEGRLVTIELGVTTPPRSLTDRAGAAEITFHAVIRRVGHGRGARLSARAPAFVHMPAGGQRRIRVEQGSRIRVDARLFSHPSEHTTAFTVVAAGTPTLVAEPARWIAWANPLRTRFLTLARTLPGDGGDLLPGLAIGDTRAVDGGLDAAMKTSSLSHLTAVSGANCAVVVVLVSTLAAAAGAGRKTRAAFALAALGGFVVLVTPDASVTRAAVMAVVALVCEVTGRGSGGLPLLGIAVLAMLSADPWIGREYGFALSVLATAGLIVLASPLARLFARRMPLRLARVIAVPAAAQVFCQPALILLAPSLSVYGVAANMLADAPASAATVLGLVSCLLLPMIPGLGEGLAQLAWLPSAWIAWVARTSAGLPAATLPWLPGLPGLLAAALGTVVTLILAFTPPGRRTRTTMIAAAAGVVLIGSYAGVTGVQMFSGSSRPRDWMIAACDVGQGDGLVLHSGSMHAVIDVGPEAEPMSRCLRALGVRRVDLLVLTHYDLDHVGGLDAVLGKTSVALVGPSVSAGDRRIVDQLTSAGADVRQAVAGDHGTLGRMRWDVVWPRLDRSDMTTGNERSVTLRVETQGMRAIFLGDLDEKAQQAIADGGVQATDVVKVAHHGSADQSPELYAALHARLGVISVGAGNRYGHPTERLLGILKRVGTPVVRTDMMGMLLVHTTADGRLAVWSQTPPRRAPPTG
jgi:competence protein ComEC